MYLHFDKPAAGVLADVACVTAIPVSVAAVVAGNSVQTSTAAPELVEPAPAEPAPAGVDDGDPDAAAEVAAEVAAGAAALADADDPAEDEPGTEFGDDFGVELPQPARSTRLAMAASAQRW